MIKEYYETKRIYVVIDAEGTLVDTLEKSIKLPKDWKSCLQKRPAKGCAVNKSPEEEALIKKWQGKEGYEIILGVADNLSAFISSIPEISRRARRGFIPSAPPREKGGATIQS